ncbi:hypothetical protein QUF88_03790 [Bacillus sp. DX1.1]|uniref:hypothetical protein n=1 Tax=unclassified Bacillus (in: firmicutes) TaxID=185979 RepID=UPI002571108E|nr:MULTISPECIES: hypothetical protein [unclassified Bacillus (in: firmicutes)]MDM5153045.1 hypothetical protein [Bacillus sp. DX1.1]WJE82019.1 hypothetical protein QRE67_01320 [Bacillus sp. DX3.1]
MNPTSRIHFFSYKSAFLFFSFILAFNLIFNPLMNAVGIDKQLSMYLGNTFAISAGLTIVITLVEGKFKNKKQALNLFLSLLVVSALICYFIVYA